MPRLLILAGTTEATQLSVALEAAGHHVVSSLAGLTSAPVSRAGQVRRGGFGGVQGLVHYLIDERIDAVIDATHPFAAVMPFHAASAAARVAIPHCRLLRPAWSPVEHDRWRTVPSIEAAPGELTKIGATRVFLAVGRQSAARFAGCEGIWFLARAIEPIGDALPGAHVVLQRGPFALDDELELLAAHRIDTIVAKNSGGLATAAKLDAARRLGLVVVMIERPPQPTALRLDSVEAATHWCAELG